MACPAAAQTVQRASHQTSCTAIVGISVIPMDREQVLHNRTVLIRGERIAAVAEATAGTVPRECSILDGRDRYVIPGLVDSHVHLPLEGRADQLLVLQMLLANGITTGINMEGSAGILALRNFIRREKPDLPTIYTTGLFIQQPAFMTAAQVSSEVHAEKSAGYDLIKVHGELTQEAYDALFDTARQEHIRVVIFLQDGVLLRGRWLSEDRLQKSLMDALHRSRQSADE
jgi:hypothetical protein